jgi:hypothetical protein
MSTQALLPARITVEGFLADRHATRYRDVIDDHPEAFAQLLAIVNDPLQQVQLVAAERYGRPALSGVVQAIEADEHIVELLDSPASARFRQTVGVVVKLEMQALGWSTTGRKGPVRGAKYFKQAERYEPPPLVEHPAEKDRARAALEAITEIGDEPERAATAAQLLRALADSRRAENRPF